MRMCAHVGIYTYLSKIYISNNVQLVEAFVTVKMWRGRPWAMKGREENHPPLALSHKRGYLKL